VPDREQALGLFPLRVRDRLESFAEAVETLPHERMAIYAVSALDASAHDAARETADRAASEHQWDRGIAALRALAVDWVSRGLVDRPPWMASELGMPTRVLRPADTARLAQSLADAFRAVAMWDDLHETDRDELLGPWASLVETA
jgi:hypothetical protein